MTKSTILIQLEDDSLSVHTAKSQMKTNDKPSIPDNHKKSFQELEYEKALETYRTQLLTIVQIVTGFVAVNATVIGLGVSFQTSWLFVVGALISFVTGLVIRSGERAMRVFLMRVIQLEAELGDGDSSITSLWAAFLYGAHKLREFQAIASLERVESKIEELRKLTSRFNSNKYLLLVGLAVVGQIALAVILSVFFGWSVF